MITCHDIDPERQLRPDLEITWQDPRPELEPAGVPYRTCSWCGSIHPDDLVAYAAGHPLTAEATDLKLHKIYIRGIPNPKAGRRVQHGSRSIGIRPKLDMLAADSGVLLATSRQPEATDDELFDHGWRIVTREEIHTVRTRDGEEETFRRATVSYDQPLYTDSAPADTFTYFRTIHLRDLEKDSAVAKVLAGLTGLRIWWDDQRIHWAPAT